jgi:mycothiol synthase
MDKTDSHPSPPGLDSLNWRKITPDDLDALVQLAETCRRADGGIAFMNEPGHLKRRFFGDGPAAAIGAFSTGSLAPGELVAGTLMACATARVAPGSPANQAVLSGLVHPDLRRRGLGTFLMNWSHDQARRLFSAAGQAGGSLKIATESLTDPADRLYRTHGYEPAAAFLLMGRDLTRPLPDRPFPAGVTVAEWQPGLERPFYLAYHAAFRDRPGFPGWSDEQWIAWTADDNLRPDWSLLAMAGDQSLAFVTAGIEHGVACIFQVGVIPAQRRRGLASAVLVETMRRQRAAGQTSTELTVNYLNNPGMILTCRRLGFETTGRRATYERPFHPLEES